MAVSFDPHNRPPAAARLLPFVNAALIICAAVWTASMFRPLPIPVANSAGAALVILALAATMLALARTLPVQNVLAATALIIVFSAGADFLNSEMRIPFGARVYTDALGPRLFGLPPWPVPLLWAGVLLNSRGVARLALRPWRKTSKYGLWVIGLACLLAVIFDTALEPLANRVNAWWIWTMPPSVPAWQSAPWCNFLAWAVVAIVTLAFVTPWLINKQRSRSSPPDYHPLLLWLLLNLIPAIGDAAHQLWLPAAVAIILAAIVTTFALRGAKW